MPVAQSMKREHSVGKKGVGYLVVHGRTKSGDIGQIEVIATTKKGFADAFLPNFYKNQVKKN